MKEILKEANTRVLMLSPDEEAVSALADYCTENDIKAGWVQFIGASKKVNLYYYNLATKQYESKDFETDLEVLPCFGNIGTYEGKTIVHVHGSFSDHKYLLVGGHVNSLVVSATLEVHLQTFAGEITRQFDDFTGLKLMCPPQ